jgi:predicted HNH restriction endonuclease
MSRFQDYCRQIRKSKPWKARRARYWETHKRICKACSIRPCKHWYGWTGTIDLHHLSHAYELGHEPDDALLPLCRRCHDAVHERLRKIGFDLDDETIRKTSLWVMYRIREHAQRSERLRRRLRLTVTK